MRRCAGLRELGASHLGIDPEDRNAPRFENLPELLFAAMAGPSAGVMIARGDPAVECGYERLAEVQEKSSGPPKAAHMPVWAGDPGAGRWL